MPQNKMYESEVTQFIRELLDKQPQLREEQKKARAMWWDKTLDPGELERERESQVPRQGYVYYDNPKTSEQ
jgi:Protein of unknown function (DUF3460)